VKIRATSPVYCGRCGQRRGLVHTCIVRRPRGRAKVKAPRVTLIKCGRCGQEYANPLTHVCPPKRGDFRRRKAAAERAERKRKAAELRARRKAEAARRRAAGGARPRAQHNYATCREADCQRRDCRIYREGIERGMAAAREMSRS
jgi:hypothetical protein